MDWKVGEFVYIKDAERQKYRGAFLRSDNTTAAFDMGHLFIISRLCLHHIDGRELARLIPVISGLSEDKPRAADHHLRECAVLITRTEYTILTHEESTIRPYIGGFVPESALERKYRLPFLVREDDWEATVDAHENIFGAFLKPLVVQMDKSLIEDKDLQQTLPKFSKHYKG